MQLGPCTCTLAPVWTEEESTARRQKGHGAQETQRHRHRHRRTHTEATLKVEGLIARQLTVHHTSITAARLIIATNHPTRTLTDTHTHIRKHLLAHIPHEPIRNHSTQRLRSTLRLPTERLRRRIRTRSTRSQLRTTPRSKSNLTRHCLGPPTPHNLPLNMHPPILPPDQP